MTYRKLTTLVLAALAAVALLVPAQAEAQRICFSFASDSNADGPTFLATPLNLLNDASAVDPSGAVVVNLLIQPFCNVGPLSVVPVEMLFVAELGPYGPLAFLGNSSNNWGARGMVQFIDLAGTLVLEIHFDLALLTSWSVGPNILGPTAVLQDSEFLDPNIVFLPGPVLSNIMAAAGFPPGQLGIGENFAFTLTNIQPPVGVPLGPIGEFNVPWVAEGSFSASAGQ